MMMVTRRGVEQNKDQSRRVSGFCLDLGPNTLILNNFRMLEVGEDLIITSFSFAISKHVAYHILTCCQLST